MEFRKDLTTRSLRVFAILGMAAICAQGQFLPCLTDATSCCQCITRPGCLWAPLSPDSTSNQTRCLSLAMASEPNSAGLNALPPLVNYLEVLANRPFNRNRKRYLRPQAARLKMALGLRKEVRFEVQAKTRRMRISITGPIDSPEFSVEKADELSCAHRFRIREKTASVRRRGPQGRSQSSGRVDVKKINIDCHVSAAGDVQRFNLIVDMNQCYTSSKEIKIYVRERGSRRFRLGVTSACTCTCPPPTSVETGDDQRMCEDGEEFQQCVPPDGGDAAEEGNLCSGVNQYCRRDQHEPACSGRGMCICGVCMCDYISQESTQTDAAVDPTIALGAMPERRQRYTGQHCQCDDFSCPTSNGLICGGPDRGICRCGSCVCRGEYEGGHCGVSTSAEPCRSHSGQICDGHGMCINGLCECEEYYFGSLCADHIRSQNTCTRVSPCVGCLVSSVGEANNAAVNCSSACDPLRSDSMRFTPSDGDWPESSHFCVMGTDGSPCHYEYAYNVEENGETVVYYRNEVHCAEH